MWIDPKITEPELARENFIVLSALQALWGAVSTNVESASIEFRGNDVRAHFLLRRQREEDRLEVEEEFVSEVEALLHGSIEPVPMIETVVHVSDGSDAFPPLPGRLLWWFKKGEAG
jgi:hypothetical protein